MNGKRWLIVLAVLGTLVVGCYAVLCGVVYKYQDRLIFFPDDYMSGDPEAVGLPFEDFSIEHEDGATVTGWIVEKDKDAPWILHFHGNAGNISNRLDHLRLFEDLGFNGVVFDYRGYGKSQGTPSESGLVEDGIAVVEHLLDKREVPKKSLIYFGESLGGGVAASVAQTKPPQAMILKSTFTSIPDLGSDIYGFLPVSALSRHRFETKSKIEKFLFPLLVVHSRSDTLIPFQHGQRLYQLAPEPKLFFESYGGHNASPLELGEEFKKTIKDFVTNAVPSQS